MKRVLCIQFVDWPIQRLQRQLNADAAWPLALHTAASPGSHAAEESRRSRTTSAEESDLKFVRSLFPSARTGPTIIAASAAAWNRGVRPGMPLAEARSIAAPIKSTRAQPIRTPETRSRDILFQEWLPLEDRKQLIAAAELTRSYAPLTGLDTMPCPDSLLLDITGCAPLFGGESALAESLLTDLRKAGYRCRVVIADLAASGWAVCHGDGVFVRNPVPPATRPAMNRRHAHATSRSSGVIPGPSSRLPVFIIPPGQHLDAVGHLPLNAGRLEQPDIAILSHLGIRTLQQLLGLPRQDLPARISAGAVERIQQLTGILPELIHPIPEASPVSAAWSSEFPADSQSELQQVICHLLDQIGPLLVQRRLGCLRLNYEFSISRESSVSLSVELVRSSQSVEQLRELTFLRLDVMPFPGPVHKASVTVTTGPIPLPRQRDLFGELRHAAAEDELALLVNRLSSRLGNAGILTVRHADDSRPEHALIHRPLLSGGNAESPGQLSNDVLEALVTPLPFSSPVESSQAVQRPLRLLPVPFLIARQSGEELTRNGFVWLGQRFQIARIDGPERIQTGWWTANSVQRDYYRIEVTSGSTFWIYRNLATSEWYLHGIFD